MTAAVSSVSLNWGIFALSLGGYVCLQLIYTSSQAKVSRSVECRADFGYLSSILAFQEVKSDAGPPSHLAGIRRHVEDCFRADREPFAPALHRSRTLSGNPAHGLSARSTGPPLGSGLGRY